MNKINFDFENRKIDYKWNVAVLIHSLFALIYVILFLALADKFEFDKDTFNDVSASRNRTGTFSDIVIYNRHEKTDNEKKIIKDLESKITGLNLVITNLNTKIVDITKERDIL